MKNLPQKLEQIKEEVAKNANQYRPQILDPANSSDLATIEVLLESPGIKVFDDLAGQIRELKKFEHASRKLTQNELQEMLKSYLQGKEIHLCGVWVYYPWSNRLVHILDEPDFITVRTSRNQYKITPGEQKILQQKKVGVIGLSVGQSVAVTLAMERICSEIRLADFDVLELTNLNRIRTGVHNLGIPKVVSVAREIAEIDPFIKVLCFAEGLTDKNMDRFFTGGGKLDLLVEESDGFDIKILCRHKARELGVPVIMEGSDRCLVDVERFDLEPRRPILHGLVDHLDINMLKSLKTNEEKIPYMLDILELESCSLRLRASMLEIDQTINTWPQLASAVTMGGGITADVGRRILLNTFRSSGRYHVDIEELIGDQQKQAEVPAHDIPDLPSLRDFAPLYTPIPGEGQAELTESEVRKIVEAACLAPSGANIQPWRWVWKNKTLLLYNAAMGYPAYLAYNDCAAMVGLGAAAQNAELAATAIGLTCEIRPFPVKHLPQLVAEFRFYKSSESSRLQLSPEALYLRLTNRQLGERKTIEASMLGQLKNVSVKEHIDLSFFTDEKDLAEISALLGELETIRVLDPWGHRDFVNEIRWTSAENEEKRDGIDLKTLDITNAEKAGLEVFCNPGVRQLLSEWGGGGAFKKLTAKSIASAGAVGIFTLSNTSPLDYFEGGMAIERLWLKASELGIAFQPMSASVFAYVRLLEGKGAGMDKKTIESLKLIRKKFEKVFEMKQNRRELFIFRLSYAEQPKIKSLRKPLDEVFINIDRDAD